MLTVSPLPGLLDLLPVRPDVGGAASFAPLITSLLGAGLLGPEITVDCTSLPSNGEKMPVATLSLDEFTIAPILVAGATPPAPAPVGVTVDAPPTDAITPPRFVRPPQVADLPPVDGDAPPPSIPAAGAAPAIMTAKIATKRIGSVTTVAQPLPGVDRTLLPSGSEKMPLATLSPGAFMIPSILVAGAAPPTLLPGVTTDVPPPAKPVDVPAPRVTTATVAQPLPRVALSPRSWPTADVTSEIEAAPTRPSLGGKSARSGGASTTAVEDTTFATAPAFASAVGSVVVAAVPLPPPPIEMTAPSPGLTGGRATEAPPTLAAQAQWPMAFATPAPPPLGRAPPLGPEGKAKAGVDPAATNVDAPPAPIARPVAAPASASAPAGGTSRPAALAGPSVMPAVNMVWMPTGDRTSPPAPAPAPIATAPMMQPTAPITLADLAPPLRRKIASEPSPTGTPGATSSAPAPSPIAAPTILPALQAFGAAIRRAMADERQPALPKTEIGVGLTAPAGLATVAVAQPMAASTPTLDTADRRWPLAMVEQIEQLRDAADAQSTRIRLLPDALGPVDVAVRRDGGQVHVHFTAADAQTRQLLAEAQPRLADAAEARGVKLGRTDISGGDLPSGDRQQQRPAAQNPHPSRPAPARAHARVADIDDSRLA